MYSHDTYWNLFCPVRDYENSFLPGLLILHHSTERQWGVIIFSSIFSHGWYPIWHKSFFKFFFLIKSSFSADWAWMKLIPFATIPWSCHNRWRIEHIEWQEQAKAANRPLGIKPEKKYLKQLLSSWRVNNHLEVKINLRHSHYIGFQYFHDLLKSLTQESLPCCEKGQAIVASCKWFWKRPSVKLFCL